MESIQLSADICTERAKPIAVAGRESNAKKLLLTRFCMSSMTCVV